MLTVPSPRYKFYQNSDSNEIKKNVFAYTNEVVNALGFFQVNTAMPLLHKVEGYNMPILYIGLVANMVVILFVIIAILLIYSLLMISIEKKTFEFGVMRLIGLSSHGLISLIAIQAVFFVLPAIVTAFILSVPTLAMIYYYMVSTAAGYSATPIPTG